METRKCIVCGDLYKPNRINQKYCKQRCKEKHNREFMPNKSEWSSWRGMVWRCTNADAATYKYYGGKGVEVCSRWRVFKNFLSDMGKKPSPLHQIDRIDGSGNYCVGNCRWATPQQNGRNKDVVTLSEASAKEIRERYNKGGILQRELADEYGVTGSTISAVVRHKTWKDVA